MSAFDAVVVVDWSARARPSPKRPGKDAIFVGIHRSGETTTRYCRTRAAAMEQLEAFLRAALAARERTLVALDFPFAYPAGFASAVAGTPDPLTLWRRMAELVEDGADNANNRFSVASAFNALFVSEGPFWGHPFGREVPGVPFRKPGYGAFPFEERRRIEQAVPRAKSCFQLMGAGSVGSQAILGIARLQALRETFGAAVSVAPFEAPLTPIVLAECYPGLIADAILKRARPGEIADAAQVRVLATALGRLAPARLTSLLTEGDRVEGWILGQGAEAELSAVL